MDKHNSQITINVSFNQQNHTFTINHGISIAELKQMIFTHFQIDTMTYCLLYKSYKLSLEEYNKMFEDTFIEYLYLWKDNQWYAKDCYHKKKNFIPLDKILEPVETITITYKLRKKG